MSGKQAKKARREAKMQQEKPWTEEIPHPLEEISSPVEVAEVKQDASSSSGPVLLSLKQLAEKLNVSPRTVQRMEKDQGLPGRVAGFGGLVRYHWETIEKWLLDRVKK
jgi:transcriptional regulator with XRE-family HTH domain